MTNKFNIGDKIYTFIENWKLDRKKRITKSELIRQHTITAIRKTDDGIYYELDYERDEHETFIFGAKKDAVAGFKLWMDTKIELAEKDIRRYERYKKVIK